MEMDRQTLLVVFGMIIVLTLIGVSWLAGKPMERPLNQPVYSQDDIRLKYQQQAAHSRKGLKSPPPEEAPSNDSVDREESSEEPPAEEPDAEEPSIEDDNNN